jgi:formylglycine-generating enzyme required for sulfatase activity
VKKFQHFLLFITLSMIFSIIHAPVVMSNPKSTIPVIKIGSLLWDQTEMTIADVKIFTLATGFISQAEKNGGGLSYESGFVKKSGWNWKTPYGVNPSDREPAVHLNQKEADLICRHFGKRLPTDAEWTSAAYLEQRDDPPSGFTKGQRYPYPGGSTPKNSQCLSGCGDYKGLAPLGALNRGTGHVATGTTIPGVNGLFDMGGNVWEWTSTESNGGFITRGASWWYGPERQLESDIESKSRDIAVVYIGFRCVANALR